MTSAKSDTAKILWLGLKHVSQIGLLFMLLFVELILITIFIFIVKLLNVSMSGEQVNLNQGKTFRSCHNQSV